VCPSAGPVRLGRLRATLGRAQLLAAWAVRARVGWLLAAWAVRAAWAGCSLARAAWPLALFVSKSLC